MSIKFLKQCQHFEDLKVFRPSKDAITNQNIVHLKRTGFFFVGLCGRR